MEIQNVFDDSGIWIENKSAFVFFDPMSGCRFLPGVRTKAPLTDWVRMQESVLVPEAVAKVEPAPVAAPAAAAVKPKA